MEQGTKRKIGLGGWLAGGVLIVAGYFVAYWELSLFGVLLGTGFWILWRLHL